MAKTVKTKQVDKQRQIVTDYKSVFGSEQGKRVLYDMMKAHHVTSTSHVTKDPDATAFNEGGRNAVLRIMTYVGVNLEKFDQAIKQGEEQDDNYEY